jgi:hypothetical protein
MVRKTMTKAERRQYVRLPKAVRQEIYYTTLQMIAELQLQARE